MRFLLAAALAACFATAPLFAGVSERVAKAIEERVAAGQYPVVVIAVVDGDQTDIRAFGKLPDGKTPNGDTVFEIGSVTKTFTATLLADAVTRGAVKLDQPVGDLLPGWSIPSRGGKVITLVDIASQRSGLPRMPSNFAPADPHNPYPDYTSAKLKDFLGGYTLSRDPGAQYEYSNLGFALLGTALAEKAHTSYGALASEKIFTPLGMTSTATVTTAAMRLAPGHNEQGKPQKNWDFDVFAPAGAIRSTASDMVKYLKANMAAGAGSPMALAHQPRQEIGGGNKIGLAWMVTGKLGIVWHNGMTGGYASFVGFSADHKHGVVVLTNVAASVDDLAFATLVPEAPLAAPNKAAVNLSTAALDAVSGTFKLDTGLVMRTFREGELFYLRADGQPAVQIYASGPNDFFVRIAPISLTFTRDAAGGVTGLVLHQNGDHTAAKIAEPVAPPLVGVDLEQYAGQYSLGAANFVFVVKDGQLFAQLATQPSFAVYPSGKDQFFYKVVDAQLSFERDAAGKVVAVVLHQNGHDMRAPKQ